MIDHITLLVSNYEASKAFYLGALAPLGYTLVLEFEGRAGGFGVGGKPDLWIRQVDEPFAPTHLAFHSADRKSVDAFHAAALEAGGKDNGGPGLRVHYHPNYYGAFVFDPDGYNIEAVCHTPE